MRTAKSNHVRLADRDRRRSDRGSLSIEFVIVTPMIFLVLALIYAYARVSQVNGVLDTGTRDAARVATQANNYDAAYKAAVNVITDEIRGERGNGPKSCLDSLVVPSFANQFHAGDTITVSATCTYSFADLGLPGPPASLTVTSQFSSMIDPNKTIADPNRTTK